MQKPFKELSKEERVIVARAKSRAVRAKAGMPVASPEADAPAATAEPAAVPEPVAEEEAPAAVADAGAADDADDPMAEVPAELLQKPFKELSKEERVIVARARSRAVRARSGSA